MSVEFMVMRNHKVLFIGSWDGACFCQSVLGGSVVMLQHFPTSFEAITMR